MATPKATDITLGEIRDAILGLIERGAHPGSIDWVLRNQVPSMMVYYHQEEFRTACCNVQAFPDGTCCNCFRKA